MKSYTRGYAKIDLDAIAYNVITIKNSLKEGTGIIVVIKADGYGHGAVPIANMLEQLHYIWGFAVATLDEAVVLRSEGVKKPILVLGCIFPDQYREMLDHDIRMNVYTEEMAQAISRIAVEEGKQAYLHTKLDTGMGRLGFDISEESVTAIEHISKMDHVVMEGIFTHFAKADEEDKTYTREQMEKFCWMVEKLEARNVEFEHKHCANSAAIIDMPESNFDLVRSGIATYGLYPSDEVKQENLYLKPALALKSHVAFVKKVSKGTAISYGGTYISEKDMLIATVPLGYADGYPRSLSNNGYVLIRGRKAPIVGRICMDQFMVDVTEIPDTQFGDKVTLIGRDKDIYLSVETLAELSGRFNYEFVCDLNKRIPRAYLYHGRIEEQIDYFA